MNRRRFLRGAVAIPLATTPFAATSGTPPVAEKRSAPATQTAARSEPLGARYRLTRDRVLHGTEPAYTPAFLLEDIRGTPGRRFTNYSGDVSGRWIAGLAAASAVYGEKFPVLDEVVRRVVELQHPEGYFGKNFHFDHPGDDDLALLWGNGRLLVGLMEYYALTHDAATLKSATRLAEFLLRIAPRFNTKEMEEEFGAAHFASGYICWTQLTEGLAALYVVTQDARHRDLCAAIAQRMQRKPGDHVHGYLCSVRGTLDLHHATGDPAYLEQVEAAWRDIVQSEDVLITGGVPEAWSPKKKRTEGCAECDWVRLNLALWRTTHSEQYLNMAERILFNEFAMNQLSTGDFGHGTLDEFSTPEIVDVRAWWCCTLHGLRAFPDIQSGVFRLAGDQVFYDLPIDGQLHTPTLSAKATSRLAEDGTVRIEIDNIAAGHFLTIRKPVWASDLTLTLNGGAVDGLRLAGLRAGDVVAAKYTMALSDRAGEATHGLGPRKAFSYGPWLLGVPSAANPRYFNENHRDNLLLADTAQPTREASATPFDVALAAVSLAYLPAEFPDQPSTVQLHAVAEQTGMLPTRWETTFLLATRA